MKLGKIMLKKNHSLFDLHPLQEERKHTLLTELKFWEILYASTSSTAECKMFFKSCFIR